MRALLLATFLLFSGDLYAEGRKGYVGIFGGVSLSNTGSGAFTYGGTLSYRFIPIITPSLFIMTYSVSAETVSDDGQASISASSTYIGPQANIDLDFLVEGTYLGLKFGLGILSANVSATDADGNTITFETDRLPFILGPTLGYHHMMGRFSIGGEIHYIFGFGSTAPQVFSLLAPLKFWF